METYLIINEFKDRIEISAKVNEQQLEEKKVNASVKKIVKLIKKNNFFGYPENSNYLYDYIKALKKIGLEVDLIERIVDCSSDVVENVLGISKTRIREKLD